MNIIRHFLHEAASTFLFASMEEEAWSKKNFYDMNRIFAYAKTKPQISCAVTAQVISAFVFATRIVQFLFFLNPKFQACTQLLWLHRPVCVGHGWKP